MLVDTHAHLNFPEFREELPAVIDRARAAGVERIVTISTDLTSARENLAIARAHPGVYAAVGLHPGQVPEVSLCDLKELRTLVADERVVAIGEIGLDYYRLPSADTAVDSPVPAKSRHDGAGPASEGARLSCPPSPDGQTAAERIKQQQKDLFWAQLELAAEHHLPVVIHNRAAEADLIQILRRHQPRFRPWGVMHCFSGDATFAEECRQLGLLVSYTGILTFKNAEPLRGVARHIDLGQVMLETDAPYLAPVPHRGQRNEPAFIPHIASVLAGIHQTTVAEVARVTTANAFRLFGLA